jgi:hypothetical protein
LKIVPLRHFLPLKVVPLIEVLLYVGTTPVLLFLFLDVKNTIYGTRSRDDEQIDASHCTGTSGMHSGLVRAVEREAIHLYKHELELQCNPPISGGGRLQS